MSDSGELKLPLYAKLTLIVLGLLAFFYILYIGQDIIVPVVFAMIIAILLNPIVNYLTSKKVNRIISIVLVLFVAFILTAALVYFIISQLSLFGEALPQFKVKFKAMGEDLTQWISTTFNIPPAKISEWIKKTQKDGVGGMAIVGQALGTLKGLLVLFIMPVYVFIILFYKALFLEFIAQLFKKADQKVVEEVLLETKSLIQNYLVGLSIEAALVATLNSVGLLILGIQYAVLLGIIGALLNVIPYIGGLIAIALPMLVAIATKSTTAALWVFLVYIVVQFIDNQYIVPRIVASKVKINAFISILVVLIGGSLWGVGGMFLAIPMTAIVKVIFDRIEALKPFGLLLGDTQPGEEELKILKKKRPAKK